MHNYDVCIIIRNHDVARQLLSSFENKAIISHIIDRFPSNTKIVFSMAEGTNLLQQYIKIAHDHERFIIVKDQGLSEFEDIERKLISNTKQFLDRSFLLIQEPLWWQAKITTRENWMAVCLRPQRIDHFYQSVNVSNDFRIKSFNQKQKENAIFLGFGYISDHQAFWSSIDCCKTLSEALEYFIKNHEVYGHFFSKWQELNKISDGKDDPLVFKYRCSNKQVSLYIKATDCLKVISKHDNLSGVFPKITNNSLNAITFDIPKGVSLKTYLSPSILFEYLQYLETNLWDLDNANSGSSEECLEHYQSLHRSICHNLSTKKHLILKLKEVSTATTELQSLLHKINWSKMSNCLLASVHGNLWLKNAIYQQSTSSFHLLDPSPKMNTKGDLYLDLGKLYASLRYHLREDDQIIEQYEIYLKHKSLDAYKVKTIAALCLLENFNGNKLTLLKLAKTLLAEAQSHSLPEIIPFSPESAK